MVDHLERLLWILTCLFCLQTKSTPLSLSCLSCRTGICAESLIYSRHLNVIYLLIIFIPLSPFSFFHSETLSAYLWADLQNDKHHAHCLTGEGSFLSASLSLPTSALSLSSGLLKNANGLLVFSSVVCRTSLKREKGNTSSVLCTLHTLF